jgi:hypothetical protein
MSSKLIVHSLNKKYTVDIKNIIIRSYATKAAAAEVKPATEQGKKPKVYEKPVESTSFVLNLFRGQMKLGEVFPYPNGGLTDF